MALELGSTLGHYEILSSLGAGGMGEVYRDSPGHDQLVLVQNWYEELRRMVPTD